MNPPPTIKLRALAALTLAGAVALSLPGCSIIPPEVGGDRPVAAGSPVAAEILEASRHPGPHPTFAEIPKVPKDVRPASQWRAAVAEAKQDRARIAAEAAQVPATLDNSDAWAAEVRARAEAPPSAEAASTEEFLREMQAKARPPAPPK